MVSECSFVSDAVEKVVQLVSFAMAFLNLFDVLYSGRKTSYVTTFPSRTHSRILSVQGDYFAFFIEIIKRKNTKLFGECFAKIRIEKRLHIEIARFKTSGLKHSLV